MVKNLLGGDVNSFIVWNLGFCCITQQSGFLMIEVSLSLNACMFVVCLLTVQWRFTWSFILVLPTFHGGCIQHWSGNGKCIFHNKIEKFCCNFNFCYIHTYHFLTRIVPPPPPPPPAPRNKNNEWLLLAWAHDHWDPA